MRWKVYVETSVISYLISRLSRDLIVAGHQQITQEWWANQRDKFERSFHRQCLKNPPEAIRKRPNSG